MKDIFFAGGVLTVADDCNSYVIHVGARTYFFEFDSMWGPLFVGARGEDIDNSKVQQSAFRAVTLWARQGKQTRAQGLHLAAIWNEPPPITFKYVKQGRSRLIVGNNEPEGYDPEFSKEIFVEVAA